MWELPEWMDDVVWQSDLFAKTTKEIETYVVKTYPQGGDMSIDIGVLKIPAMADPPDPPDNATKTQLRKWEKRVDKTVKLNHVH